MKYHKQVHTQILILTALIMNYSELITHLTDLTAILSANTIQICGGTICKVYMSLPLQSAKMDCFS